jgi:general stress protein 26
MSHDKPKSDVELLNEKIKDIHIAMLTTIEADGTLRSRPMGTQDVEADGSLWFFTKLDAPKVGEVQHHQQVNVAYANPGDNVFVSVSGTAQLVQDQQKIKQYWKPIYKTWFPQGEDEPDLALLKVTIERAEFWDAPSGKMGLLYTITKGLATHAKDQAGENVKLDMK